MAYHITKKRMRHGLQLFTLLSLSSIIAIFAITHSHITVEAIRNMNPLWLLAALPFIVVDWAGGGYRLYVFSRVFYPDIKFKTCMKANLANYFMAAITPSQTGGGPAQIYVLYAGGMPMVEATSASLMTFFSTTFFLIAAAGGIFLFKRSVPLPGRLMGHLFNVGVLFFLGVAALMLIAVAFPGFYRESAKLFFVVLCRLRKKDYFAAGSRVNRMLAGIDRVHGQLIHYLQKQWHIFLLGIVLSGVCFFAKFVIAYIVVRSFGVPVSFVEVALLQMVIILINYFFPSPGGSGAAEFSAAALMASIVSKAYVPFYVVLWRLLTNYISVAVGGLLFLRELGKREEVEVESVIDEAAGEELASVQK
jgi:uncharacterized protein (TIRG00374 family)